MEKLIKKNFESDYPLWARTRVALTAYLPKHDIKLHDPSDRCVSCISFAHIVQISMLCDRELPDDREWEVTHFGVIASK